MKYTKFEKWMVGKSVTYRGYKGKVTKGCEYGDSLVYILWEANNEAIIEFVEGLEFVEEPENTQVEIDWQGSQINWQVGQEVWCAIYGKGVVEAVLEDRNELEVRINGEVYLYDLKGCPFGSKVRTLFFSEPKVKIEGDEYPPKKPFTPTLKEGEGVLLWVSEARYPKFVTILKEGETAISYLENGQEQRSYKQGIKIKRIGEEVKL